MILFIDCEFNDYCGELISMALVDQLGQEWYEVLECQNPSPWVAEHVIPVLGKAAVPLPVFQGHLGGFLGRYEDVIVVADWPEDIAHFCQALITGPGTRIDTPPLTMMVDRQLHTNDSLTPHNALADARALRLLAMGIIYEGTLDEPSPA